MSCKTGNCIWGYTKLDFEITPQTEKELIFDNEEEVDIISNDKTKAERLKKRIRTDLL